MSLCKLLGVRVFIIPRDKRFSVFSPFDCFGCVPRTSGLEGHAASSPAAASASSGGGSSCRRIVPREHHLLFWGGDTSGGDGGSSGGGGHHVQLPGGRRAAAERVRTFSVRADDYSAFKFEDDNARKLPATRAMTVTPGGESADDAAPGYGGGTGSGGGGGSSSSDRYVRLAGAHVTAFLRTALLMVHVCMGSLPPSHQETTPPAETQAAPPSPPGAASSKKAVEGSGEHSSPGPAWTDGAATCLPSADDKFLPLCRFFGFPSSAEALLAEPGLVDAARRCALTRVPEPFESGVTFLPPPRFLRLTVFVFRTNVTFIHDNSLPSPTVLFLCAWLSIFRRWLACVADPAAFRSTSRPRMGTADRVLLSRRREVVSRRLFDFPSPLQVDSYADARMSITMPCALTV